MTKPMTDARKPARTPGPIDALEFALSKVSDGSSTIELNVAAAEAIWQEFKRLQMIVEEHQWLTRNL